MTKRLWEKYAIFPWSLLASIAAENDVFLFQKLYIQALPPFRPWLINTFVPFSFLEFRRLFYSSVKRKNFTIDGWGSSDMNWTFPNLDEYPPEGTVLDQMKNQFFDCYFLSYGWLYLEFTMPFLVYHRPKKIAQKWPNLQERCAMTWNEWKNQFLIFTYSVMVDF